MNYKIINELSNILLDNIKIHKKDIKDLLNKLNQWYAEEDLIYRYFHHSFKFYYIQHYTLKIYDLLKKLDPKQSNFTDKEKYLNLFPFLKNVFNEKYQGIIDNGLNHKFDMSHNKEWNKHCHPMLLAFLTSKHILEMTDKYSYLDEIQDILPSGIASILTIYNLR